MLQTYGGYGGKNGEGREEGQDQKVGEADAALVILHNCLFHDALELVVDILCVLLRPLDRLPDLFLLLVEPPNVLDSSLLALPRLNVEGGPERDKEDVGVVDWRVHVAQV